MCTSNTTACFDRNCRGLCGFPVAARTPSRSAPPQNLSEKSNSLDADWWTLWCSSDLSDELLPDFGLVVELRQHRVQQLPDQTGLVVGRRVEGDQRHATHVQVGVLQGLQEVTWWWWCWWCGGYGGERERGERCSEFKSAHHLPPWLAVGS